MWGVTSLDKSVFFWAKQGFGYGYGEGFRDQNTPNLDNGLLKLGGYFETSEQGGVIGIISIRDGDLLISGKDMFFECISHRMNGKSEVDIYGWGEAANAGVEIAKVGNGEFRGIAIDSNNY